MNKYSKTFVEIKKILNKYDLILIIILLVLSALIYNYLDNRENLIAEIHYKEKLIYKLDLNNDKIVEIDEGITAEIKNGKIRLIESTCKNKYCVKQGWSNSFPIICVPNKLLILITDNKKEKLLITS